MTLRHYPVAVLLAALLPVAVQAQDAASVYAEGLPYEQFLEHVSARRAMWWANDVKETAVDSLAVRIDETEQPWRLIAISVDGCSDSANTLPYLADLVAASRALSMRITHPDSAGFLMDRFRTPDGRTATPTVVLLDADGTVVDAWVERPSALQQWYLDTRQSLTTQEYLQQKFAWYDEDAGRQTVSEVATMILRAAAAR